MSPHAPPLHGSLPPKGADLPSPGLDRAQTTRGGPAAGLASQEPAAIPLQVNGAPATTSAPTLHDWVLAQGATPESLATALNGQFVPRSQRANTVLRAGDHILTFQPITGG